MGPPVLVLRPPRGVYCLLPRTGGDVGAVPDVRREASGWPEVGDHCDVSDLDPVVPRVDAPHVPDDN